MIKQWEKEIINQTGYKIREQLNIPGIQNQAYDQVNFLIRRQMIEQLRNEVDKQVLHNVFDFIRGLRKS